MWSTHTPNDGSNIGGVMPSTYGIIQAIPTSPNGILVFIGGNAYSDFETYIVRPILPNTGNLNLSFNLNTDSNTPTVAQAIETDSIITINGWTYNCSLQLNYEENGEIQVASASGGWVNTGIIVGKLPFGVDNTYSIQYYINETTKESSIVSLTLNRIEYPIPLSLQNIAGTQRGWTDGAIFQVQLDIGANAGAYSLLVSSANYTWS